MEHDKYAVYMIIIVAIVGVVALIAVISGPSAEDLAGQAWYGGGYGDWYSPSTSGSSSFPQPGVGIFVTRDVASESDCKDEMERCSRGSQCCSGSCVAVGGRYYCE